MYSVNRSMLSLLVTCILAASVEAVETFQYRLIPGQNTISWTLLFEAGNRQVFAGLSGRLGFTVNNDNSITATQFDLTLEGPFYDDLLLPITDAPFAPGDKLADYMVADLANTGGIAVSAPGLNGNPPGPRQAYVGPQVAGDWQSVFAGLTSYNLSNLDAAKTLLFLDAQARPDIGGSFRLFPPGESLPPGPGGLQSPLLRLLPNVELVPEPATAALALAGLAVVHCRRRKR